MNPARWKRIQDVFLDAVELAPSQRAGFLDSECTGDPELRLEVEKLIESDRKRGSDVGDIIGSAAVEFAAEREVAETAAYLGRRIGPYLLVRQIGVGGMGTVYEAVRDDQFVRSVAIKLLTHGANAPDALARFRIERQILATLQHPNIASLIDGGETDDGHPYIVMEYIEGEPLIEYTRRKNLTIEERLRLFRDICAAVHHAHQMLVIHRDIKPSNVMVTGDGIVKLLDFGIAKLISPVLAVGNQTTLTIVRRLTPQYASPEQVRGEPLSTATDIYSLGVLLYELLSYEFPYRVTGSAPHDVERAICETDPVRLSAVVKNDPRLRRQLSGDLENIVAMALRKEPARRYASALQFSEDIARYLSGLPIIAREDTLFYVAGKLVRRYKLAVAMVALLAVSVAAGWISTIRQARRAEQRFNQVRKLAHALLFDLHGSIQSLPGSTPVREQLVRTGLEYLNMLSKDSAGDATLEWELSQAYELIGDVQGDPGGANLGQIVPALESYGNALALVERLSAKRRDYASQSCLAWLHYKIGALRFRTVGVEEALRSYERGLAVSRNIQSELHDRRADGLLRTGYERLAEAEISKGEYEAAMDSARRAAESADREAERRNGVGPQITVARTRILLGNIAWLRGRMEPARAAFENAASRLEEACHAPTAGTECLEELQEAYRRLGDLLGNPAIFHFGDVKNAELFHRKALRLAEQLAERDRKNVRATAQLYNELRRTAAVIRQSKPGEAVALYRRALDGSEELSKIAPRDLSASRAVANTRLGYAFALSDAGQFQPSLIEVDRAIALYKQIIREHPDQRVIREDFAEAYLAKTEALMALRRADQAEGVMAEGLALARQMAAEQKGSLYRERCLALALHHMGDVHSALSRRAEAAGEYAEALAIWSRWRDNGLGLPYSQRQFDAVTRSRTRLDRAGRAVRDPRSKTGS